MMKKAAAITLSTVLLLQPMTASAVTWKNIINGLRNSGTNRYTEDGTTIEKDGDSYIVSGGILTGTTWIKLDDFNDWRKILFKEINIEEDIMAELDDGKEYSIDIDEKTNAENVHITVRNKTKIDVKNNGEITNIWIKLDDASAEFVNNGTISYEWLGTENGGQGGKLNAENNGMAYSVWIAANDDGIIRLVNTGVIVYCKDFDSFLVETKGDNSHVNIINSGTVVPMDVGNGSDNAFIELLVDKDATREEMMEQLNRLELNNMNGNNNVLVERYYWQEVDGIFEMVITGYEFINYSDTTDQPTFEVSKYDQERHEMEEKRKAEAIGGVYGSPYWVKQLYLGYHSLNLRLFVGEQQSNFKQSLSWMPDSTKQLTLRVNTDAPEKLTMRLDEKVLETLERTEFSVITLLDKSGNAVMQYSLSDLRSAYDQYGLSGEDQLVVGGANDDVMKIVNGEMKPIEE